MITLGVQEWIEMFQAIGLTDDDMTKWHQIFEERFPDDHQRFLEWLGLDEKRIKEIRN